MERDSFVNKKLQVRFGKNPGRRLRTKKCERKMRGKNIRAKKKAQKFVLRFRAKIEKKEGGPRPAPTEDATENVKNFARSAKCYGERLLRRFGG
jgi:hypothetical protein